MPEQTSSPDWFARLLGAAETDDDTPTATDAGAGDADTLPAGEQTRPESDAQTADASDPDPAGDDTTTAAGTADTTGTVADLGFRLDEVEATADRTADGVRALRSEQAELGARLDEIETVNRRLLGIYDRLVADANPFAAPTETGHSPVSGRFGVFDSTSAETDASGTDDARTDADGTEPVPHRSFDDLLREQSREGADLSDDGETAGASGDRKRAESAETAAIDRQEVPSTVPAQFAVTDYATDLAMLSWLAELVAAHGDSATRDALAYYRRLGWLTADEYDRLDALFPGVRDVRPAGDTPLDPAVHANNADRIFRFRTLSALTPPTGATGG
jgi:hypothetical protein